MQSIGNSNDKLYALVLRNKKLSNPTAFTLHLPQGSDHDLGPFVDNFVVVSIPSFSKYSVLH